MEAIIQDCRLFFRYHQAQQSDAPVTLLLHGWGCDSSIFAAFEEEWCEKASVLAVDFPGHGSSAEPPVPWGVPEYAQQIAALLGQLDIQQVQIVAHSFGGRVAIYLASHFPQLVNKMVITGGAGLREPAQPAQSKKQKAYRRLKACVRLLAKIPFLKGVAAKLQEALVQKYGSPDYKRLNSNMRQTFVKVINQDLAEFLSKIEAPTLLIWGSSDTETPLWMGQKMEQEIADAGLVVFEGRSHFAFLEEPQRFRTIVNTFFWGGNV